MKETKMRYLTTTRQTWKKKYNDVANFFAVTISIALERYGYLITAFLVAGLIYYFEWKKLN